MTRLLQRDATVNDFKVGDYVFLFFNKSGSIFSARILEKTVRETISVDLKTEYILEAYTQEGDEIVNQKIKFSEDKCSMFLTIGELREELHNHVNSAVNTMLTECESIFNQACQQPLEQSI